MAETVTVPGPREIFERMRQQWLDNSVDTGKDLAEDVIIEMPFAPPGRTRRYEGREKFLDFAAPERAAFVRQFTIEEVRNTVIHETTDQEVIVVEYELVGTIKATGRRASSPFVTVLRVRDGKTVHWREYQDTPAMAAAFVEAQTPIQDEK
ncbi:nuclear transport factor 2 family protein [Streptosporangium lutulentum]|uniref:Ketosteroid isomerase-like protein n=1 Tax=Streptosporangium lutulentum TaxID=1461250 RepID=A0ABT9QR30_9ACTN|nr:nuclear transport factor 2 family protein [Streptosporangium lutulentum]MDP9849166.1 ketosteroid isomerase-like protein [Streptosporangium lutulentum]